MTVIGRLLLRPVDRAFGAVDVENHPPRGRARHGMLNEVRVQPSEALVIVLLGEDGRLEPMERRGQRHAGLSPFTRGEHPKRRVLGQPLRVVRVLVPGQAAVDRLAQQIAARELGIASGAGIGEVSLDQRTQSETLVQLTWKKQTSIGGDRRPAELDAKLGIEREANRSSCRVTHWMMPSATREAPPKPAFLAGAERLWPDRFTVQNENAGSNDGALAHWIEEPNGWSENRDGDELGIQISKFWGSSRTNVSLSYFTSGRLYFSLTHR